MHFWCLHFAQMIMLGFQKYSSEGVGKMKYDLKVYIVLDINILNLLGFADCRT